jgi:hypothetical protein
MGQTRKRRSGFDKEVTLVFFEMLLMVKLFHWKTHSFARHKATDELYESLNEHMDTFIEVLLGKTGKRIQMGNTKSVNLVDLDSPAKLKAKSESFKRYLSEMAIPGANSDLLNIRDEILADMNKFTYLLTLK